MNQTRKRTFSLPGLATIIHLSMWPCLVVVARFSAGVDSSRVEQIAAVLAAPLAQLIAPRVLENITGYILLLALNSLLVGYAFAGMIKRVAEGRVRIVTILSVAGFVAVGCWAYSLHLVATQTFLLIAANISCLWLALGNWARVRNVSVPGIEESQ